MYLKTLLILIISIVVSKSKGESVYNKGSSRKNSARKLAKEARNLRRHRYGNDSFESPPADSSYPDYQSSNDDMDNVAGAVVGASIFLVVLFMIIFACAIALKCMSYVCCGLGIYYACYYSWYKKRMEKYEMYKMKYRKAQSKLEKKHKNKSTSQSEETRRRRKKEKKQKRMCNDGYIQISDASDETKDRKDRKSKSKK